MEQVGCYRRKMPITLGFFVDIRQHPGQGRCAIVDGQEWLFNDVAYSYEIFICDLYALKLERDIDNRNTPYGMVWQVQACRSE
ncbi:hypothetical protein EMIT0P258_80253 [Pseudomonas sp. IT-P258]|uniref:hypothetical protein n=1 Tax=Pseudomonas sp. IT-P258 TaxID=3026447 RepID=UPI0039E130FA